MSDFTQFNSLLQQERTYIDLNPPLRKQFKLNQINSLSAHFEDETITLTPSTNQLIRKLNKQQQKKDKIIKDQLSTINFLSLRERFDSNNISYPLPKKFASLLERMKTYEWNLWKKNEVFIDPVLFLIDFISLRQLISIKSIYVLTKKHNQFELQFPKAVKENLCPFREGPLPTLLQNRIQCISNLLDNKVQQKHQEYLKKNKFEDFQSLSEKLKIYHPEFDIEDIEDIELAPIDWIFNKKEKEEFKILISSMWTYYQIRNVNSVFFGNLVGQMKLRISNFEKEEIQRKIQILIKLFPDAIQIANSRSEFDQEKWIIQINKKIEANQLLKKLELFLE